ncbi:acyltransferase [Streptomyces actinomycinicus]|uniref:Acyltransferase n=1 Tax=Streptomyces actinomycinicus TaxID=1695166 RepID=A0A937ERY8_9ACTN|nr:acyltransferase [Streptomyces actinomycinicus]MBL1087503.1 acyltransferase [Streptomyces actinomycinicus]
MRAFHRAAHRLHAATPASRDRAVDALRAFAILGVVLGHWLVTALVAADGGLHTTSPLQHMPRLAPVSWLFQTLAVFFLVGGHVAAHSRATARARGDSYAVWLRSRLTRLLRPVAALLVLWAVAATALLLTGASLPTVHALLSLALSPLWFLLVFAALTAATPLVARLNPLWPLVVVLHVDLFRFGLHQGPAWLGWVNLGAGWLVPYTLGAAWARGELRSRLSAWSLLLGGTAATAALVTWAGYPASMVGVPGSRISNLNPPTLAAVTFGLAQCGLALLLRDRLRRATARPAVWAAVAVANLSAMTIYLWHQTAMMATTATGLLAGRLPGLHTPPGSLTWVAYRIAWLPVFALVLAVCWAAFRHHEQVRRRPGDRGPRILHRHHPGGTAGTASAPRSGAGSPRPAAPDGGPPPRTRSHA